MYEYRCDSCNALYEEYRKLCDYAPPTCERCQNKCQMVFSVPQVHPWDTSRRFPNIAKGGDGAKSFDTKKEYETYLKSTDQGLCSTDARIKQPHGNKTVMKFRL